MEQADNKSSDFLLSAYCHGLLSACKPVIIIILSGKTLVDNKNHQIWFFVKFGGTSSIVNKESWLSVVCFLPYCTSAFLPL